MAKVIALLISMLLAFAGQGKAQYVVEQFLEAAPLGGYENFRFFIKREMVYPREELQENIREQIILNFKVLESGKVSNLQVLEGENINFRQEAMRLFNLILWRPALEYQVPVESNVTIRFSFNTNKYKRWVNNRGYDLLPCCNQIQFYNLKIFDSNQVDEQAEPIIPDKYSELVSYLHEQLRYPAAAYRGNIQGTVRARFVVEHDGVVSNLHALNAVGGGCTQEAFRLLRSILWEPAKLNGENVRSWMEIDISFTLK